jgi:hypothetical protein
VLDISRSQAAAAAGGSSSQPPPHHHISLDVLLGVLHAQQLPVDMDDLECTLANCISQRFIKARGWGCCRRRPLVCLHVP